MRDTKDIDARDKEIARFALRYLRRYLGNAIDCTRRPNDCCKVAIAGEEIETPTNDELEALIDGRFAMGASNVLTTDELIKIGVPLGIGSCEMLAKLRDTGILVREG